MSAGGMSVRPDPKGRREALSSIAQVWPVYRRWRRRAFVWRRDLPAARKLALAFGMAALTGLMAQVRVALPFTPVPLTGQTFAVLLAGVLLGGGYGALSQLLYVALGAAGVPWFTGFGAGFSWLQGATGGYLLGFAVAAGLVGFASYRFPAVRGFAPQLVLMLLASGVILACGALHLAFVIGFGPWQALLRGVAPFVVGDAAKSVAAACVGTALLPKDHEVDADRGALERS
jgi:biotin transport system substrate-specific component